MALQPAHSPPLNQVQMELFLTTTRRPGVRILMQRWSTFHWAGSLSHTTGWWKGIVWSLIERLTEKAMTSDSSTLAWQIPWTEEPGGLQFMGSLRVGHDWVTSLSLFTFMHWRRKWQPTPVFLPGESQGRGSLMGCRLWGRRVGHDWRDLAAAAERLKLI